MSDAADPMASLAGLWADIGERTKDYLDVWRTAIAKNAADEYDAATLLVDVESLWGMAIGDMARVGAAVVDATGPLFAGFSEPADETGGPSGGSD